MAKDDEDKGKPLRDVLTDDRLRALGKIAAEAGDIAMSMRCEHALTDDLARIDVALIVLGGAPGEAE